MNSIPEAVKLAEPVARSGRNRVTWITRVGSALCDQVLVAGANFGTGLLLARWVDAEHYGAYALAYSVLLLVGAAHQAVLLEPMTVFGPKLAMLERRSYLGALIWIHWGFSVPVGCVLALSAWVLSSRAIAGDFAVALAALALTMPLILLSWLLRAACYVEMLPGISAVSAVMYAVVMGLGITTAKSHGYASHAVVFIMMAVASLPVSIWLTIKLRPSMFERPIAAAQVWRKHRPYIRWSLGTLTVQWAADHLWVVVISLLGGVAQTGALRALNNLTMPVSHAVGALTRLAQAHVSKTASTSGAIAVRDMVTRIALLFGLASVAYLIVIASVYRPLFHILYGGRFADVAHLAPWMVLYLVLNTIWVAFGVGLRALESPASMFGATVAACCIMLMVGVPAVALDGLRGLIGVNILANASMVVITAVFFRRKVRTAIAAAGN